MTSAEIRKSFLDFFAARGHSIVPGSPVIPYDDPTLLFTNAGMNQFKDVFLGTGKRSYTRVADSQKCIRVSGKHNDLEEVGRDTYHHTFFEMLGNWSFGDYYKKEAIGWAWELLTKVWGLPPERLWATVYKDDDEAERLWKSETNIDPTHVLRFGEKDNFWEMGETGPCGPCSEIHMDRTPDGTATADMVNAGLPSVMEIWNLVFIQYNRDQAGTLTPLPAKHVDTGMGFERICAVLQGTNSNYDTDVFVPLIRRVSEISGVPYDGRLDGSLSPSQAETDVAMRVISDHVRTLAFAIGDGALPSNEGRGYVLRRILRRAARFGRTLGFHDPFLGRLVPTLAETMGSIFPEVRTNAEHIRRVLTGEEESFNATLDRGLARFESVVEQIGHSKTFPGEDAFRLYDTFGFPLDLTELMASERGLKVDAAEFTRLMEEQKERSRTGKSSSGGSESEGDTDVQSKELAKEFDASGVEDRTSFVGYDTLTRETRVIRTQDGLVLLEETPFYAESGGQQEDTGWIDSGSRSFPVVHTQKSGGVHVHVVRDAGLKEGDVVNARVDAERRSAIMRNHSATHLLHAALRKVLGTHVHQAGSLVAPDYFRFDFAHFARMTDEEISEVESLVNARISENIERIQRRDVPFEEAKKTGALMFFGDKYGDRVNVIQFGDFSMEFCGGTHVKRTGDIGYFKIRSEGSIASGVRRIEAVTGSYALELVKTQEMALADRIEHAASQLTEISALHAELHSLSAKDAEAAGNTLQAFEREIEALRSGASLPATVSPQLGDIFRQQSTRSRTTEDMLLRLVDARKGLERTLSRLRMKSLGGSVDEMVAEAATVKDVRLVVRRMDSSSMDELKALGDSLRVKLRTGAALLASVADGKVQLVCVVTDDLVSSKRLDAGKIVGEVARAVGGGGGGRPHMATAGGRDAAKLDEALRNVPSIIERMLK